MSDVSGAVPSWRAKGPWRGHINQILYALIGTPVLDEATATKMAQAMASGTYFADGTEVYAAAIPPALAYSGRLNDEIETEHGEAEIRSFLALLATKLDESRRQS
jgi:hypothetical protein